MSTLNVENIQHPSSSTPAISLHSDGTMTGSLPYPNRNLIYNGAMQVHQRGTSVSSITTSGYYTSDRWRMSISSLGTWTQSIENDAPTGSGLRKSLKVLCTTAQASPGASAFFNIQQSLEGQDLQKISKGTTSAKQLTLSFWVKSNVVNTFVCELEDTDNSRGVSAAYTINSANTWEYKKITFPADTSGQFDNDNGRSLAVAFFMGVGSNQTSGTLQTTWASRVQENTAVGQTNLASSVNNYWQITGVQLETGSTATEFENEPYSVTLEKCRRYYQSYNYLNAFPVDTTSSQTYIGTNVAYSPIMRTTPNLTITAPASGTTGAVEQWGGTVRTVANTTGSNANLSYIVLSSAITSTKIFGYHLVADAEL